VGAYAYADGNRQCAITRLRIRSRTVAERGRLIPMLTSPKLLQREDGCNVKTRRRNDDDER
jgi:hypothetical protein